MQVVAKSIDEIKPYENNPRNNDDAVDAVANSIKEFGWQQPIVVDIGGVIIAGHTRYKAAQKLGLKTVPVVVAKDLTEGQVKAYRLADNKSGELAKWNDELLEDELVGIDDIDMSQFGFDELSDDSDDDLDDDMQIEGDNEHSTSNSNKLLKACGYTIELTDDEYSKLKEYFDNYVDENGVIFGAIGALIKNVTQND